MTILIVLLFVAAILYLYERLKKVEGAVRFIADSRPLDTTNLIDPRDAADTAVDRHVTEFHER